MFEENIIKTYKIYLFVLKQCSFTLLIQYLADIY